MLWVGVDVGGTFTDGVVWDDEARVLSYAKAPSTPGNPTKGVLDVVELLGADMARVERFVHGVTIGTNAILEGKGAEVWMLVTRGFRDVLEIARTNRPVLYDIRTLKTPPLVPRTRTIEIEERLLFDGSVETPLVEAQLAAAAAAVPDGADIAVAICFLHSYANAMHERTAKAAIQAARPDRYVCTSAEVLPQFREYERFNTTVLNAYIGPLMGRYLDTLKGSLAARGYEKDVFIMTSNGGVATADRSKQLPVATVLSGPAGGVAAAVHLGGLREIPNLITCDMGGTSTDVCLIEGLRIPVTNEQSIGGHANRTPQIEINAVGAGGGSIAWIDAGDILKVGPRSAGAAPGPACYGKGGTEPTVTDANLVLNRLSPASATRGRSHHARPRACAGGDRRAGSTPRPRRAAAPRTAFCVSRSRGWCRRSSRSRFPTATTRVTSRCWPMAGPAPCTPPPSPTSSRCAVCSCRSAPATSRRSDR